MGTAKKGRRKITVLKKDYVWYVKLDDDSEYYVLNILSDDKAFIVSCPLKTETAHIISKGNVFQNKKTNGIWSRYLLPFNILEIITPKFVSEIIFFAAHGDKAAEVKWNGNDVPV